DDGRIAVAIGDSGEHRLGLLDEDGDLDTVSLPENTVPLPHLDTDGSSVSFIAGSPTRPTSVMRWRPDDGTTVLERAFEMDFDQEYLSEPERITFPTSDEVAHAFYYPPQNPDVTEPTDE